MSRRIQRLTPTEITWSEALIDRQMKKALAIRNSRNFNQMIRNSVLWGWRSSNSTTDSLTLSYASSVEKTILGWIKEASKCAYFWVWVQHIQIQSSPSHPALMIKSALSFGYCTIKSNVPVADRKPSESAFGLWSEKLQNIKAPVDH